MRFTRSSFLGLLLALAPLGTIAQNAPITGAATCAVFADLTPEQFQTTLNDLAAAIDVISQDPNSDEAEVARLNNAMDLLKSVPVEVLQAEIDQACNEQQESKRIKRSRVSRRQTLPAPAAGGAGDLIGGLPVVGPLIQGLVGGKGTTGLVGGLLKGAPKSPLASRQVPGAGGPLTGLLGAPLDSALGGQLAALLGAGQPGTLGTVLGPLLVGLLGGTMPSVPEVPGSPEIPQIASRQVPGAGGPLTGLLGAPLDSALGGQLAALLGAGQPGTLGTVLGPLLVALLGGTTPTVPAQSQ